MFPLRSLGPMTTTSVLGNPASSNRFAMACAATVVLPIESVVLISINCLKMSCAIWRVASWRSAAGHAGCRHTEPIMTAIEVKHARYFNYDSPLKSKKVRMSLMPARVNRTLRLCRVPALLTGLLLGGLAIPVLGAERAQLVLFNGRILTVDPLDTIAQAL